jgi:DNA-binding CsgD family transcriptional regulator
VAAFRHSLLHRLTRFIGADSGSLLPAPDPLDAPVTAHLHLEPRYYTHFIENRGRYWRQLRDVVARLVSDGVVIDTDVYSAGQRERCEPYVDVIIPAGISSILMLPLAFQNRTTALLCLNRHGRARKFAARQAARMRAVVGVVGIVDAAVGARCQTRGVDAAITVLSPREREVARLVSSGLQNKEIASLLGTSVETVRKQTRAIYRKLAVAGRVELVARFGVALVR